MNTKKIIQKLHKRKGRNCIQIKSSFDFYGIISATSRAFRDRPIAMSEMHILLNEQKEDSSVEK